MRDAVVFAIFLAFLPSMIKRPAIAAIVYMCFSIMNPHRLAYGATHDFPFAAIAAVIAIVGLFLAKDQRHFLWSPITKVFIQFALWANFTTLWALEPQYAWGEWGRVMKTFLMILVTILAINTESDLKKLIWVLCISLGFYGAKGGLFTLTSGGSYIVWGPEGSYIAENNALALALVMAVPVIWHLRRHVDRFYLKRGIELVALLSLVSAVGSYSRGALLGGSAMLALIWLKSKTKVRTGIIVLMVIPLLLMFMPDQWMDRMMTIGQYDRDASALGRINAWYFATEVAIKNLFGGGFMVFTPRMFLMYAPNPNDFHVAHSIYFQVLAEHGFVGLGLFLALLFATWRTASKIIVACENRTDLLWVADFAAMCQASQVGYMVGGAFLSLAYYDYFYYLAAALVIIQKIIEQRDVPLSRGWRRTATTREDGAVVGAEPSNTGPIIHPVRG